MVYARQVVTSFLALVTSAHSLGRESRTLEPEYNEDSDASLHRSFVSSSDRSMKLMRSERRGIALDFEQLGNVSCTYKDWSDWQPCSKSCGNGKRVRQKLVTAGECDTFIEDEACNSGKCAINCTWQEWAAWSSCSNQCGPGIISRTRVMDAAEDGGAPCTGSGTQAFACVGANCTNDSNSTSAGGVSFGNSTKGGVLNFGTSTTMTTTVTATTPLGWLAMNITGNLILTTSNASNFQNQESVTRALIFAIANLSNVQPKIVTVGTAKADPNVNDVNVWFSISLASLKGKDLKVVNGVAASIASDINARQTPDIAKVVQAQLQVQHLQFSVSFASVQANVMYSYGSSVPATSPAPAATPGKVASRVSSPTVSPSKVPVAVAAPPEDEENPSPTPAPPSIAPRSICTRSSTTGFTLLVGTIVGLTFSC